MDEGKLTSQKSQSQRRNTVIIVKKKKSHFKAYGTDLL